MGQHFIVVLVPRPGGGWRVHFPDFPGCRAEGDRVELAIEQASREVALPTGSRPHMGTLQPKRRRAARSALRGKTDLSEAEWLGLDPRQTWSARMIAVRTMHVNLPNCPTVNGKGSLVRSRTPWLFPRRPFAQNKIRFIGPYHCWRRSSGVAGRSFRCQSCTELGHGTRRFRMISSKLGKAKRAAGGTDCQSAAAGSRLK